jgi:predicted membrane chloride channel (bestrophin family)
LPFTVCALVGPPVLALLQSPTHTSPLFLLLFLSFFSPSILLFTVLFLCHLYRIEEIGVIIEEPFSILACDAYGNTIENNIKELMDLKTYDVGEKIGE